MNLDHILGRFDDEIFQKILSKELVATLKLIDPKKLYHENLLSILKNIYSSHELLSIKFIRNYVIDTLTLIEISELSQIMNIRNDNFDDKYEIIKNLEYNSKNIQLLYTFFELVNNEILEKSIEYNKLVIPSYKLYEYQNDVLLKVEDYLNSEFNRVLLHMPTGSGKTRTAMSYIAHFLSNNRNCCVVWLANTVELIDQAYDEFEKSWSNLGNREIQLIKYYDKANDSLLEINEAFIVSGVDKMLNYYKKNVLNFTTFASKCKLVVFDEAHMVVAENYKILVETLVVINKAKFIGLSATPGRSWSDRAKDAELANFFNKQKAVIKIAGYDNPVKYLEEKGYLAKIKNTPLYSTTGSKLTETDYTYLKNNSRLPEGVLNNISQDQARNVIIIQKIIELVKVHKRILLFSINVDHAKILNGLLISMGIKSFVLTSATEPERRLSIIKKYKTPIIDDPDSIIICNFGILTTGFDAPETSCAVIARPTDSLVLYSQMVGRATRGKESKGNDEAEIVTVIDTNLQGFKETAEAFFNWEDIWE